VIVEEELQTSDICYDKVQRIFQLFCEIG